MSDSPTLALIGIGYWGKNLARNFNSLGELHTICDAREDVLETYRDTYPSVCFEQNMENVFAATEIKRVAIAAPAEKHFSIAKRALEAGKDIFVEKPLCLEAEHAEELTKYAENKQRVLMVGHLLQYHPCVERIREMVGKGELGQLQYITSNRLNLGKIRTEENALWSFAPHDLSVILSLNGNHLPHDVQCTGGSYLTGGVADTTVTVMAFPTGVRSHVYVSWLNPFKEQKLTVVGSHGMVVFDDTFPWEKKLAFYPKPVLWQNGTTPTSNKQEPTYLIPQQDEPLRRECQHFIKACEDRTLPRTDGQEGGRVLRLLQAAQKSLEQNGKSMNPQCLTGDVPGHSDSAFIHDTAVVSDDATLGEECRVWHFSHVMKNACVGNNCSLGQNVHIAPDVKIGNNVKIQNNVSVFSGVTIEDYVFLGPSCVFTNIKNPRSEINRRSLYEKTLVHRGASIGANATIVCGITIGRYTMVGAGAVVTKSFSDYALVVGNPARQIGWVSRHGHRLNPSDSNGFMTCPESGLRYRVDDNGRLFCLDLDEEDTDDLPMRNQS